MQPDPNDVIVLDGDHTEEVVALRGVWESPVGAGYTASQAIRALEELCERAPECHHCGPVQSVDTYDGVRYGRRFEGRPLCNDCVAMFYETAPEAELGESDSALAGVPVNQRVTQNHSLNNWRQKS